MNCDAVERVKSEDGSVKGDQSVRPRYLCHEDLRDRFLLDVFSCEQFFFFVSFTSEPGALIELGDD